MSKSTRERILQKALELFVEHGFHGCSVRMLASACGIRESSLYNHFPNKNAIFRAVLEQSGAEVVPRLSAELTARDEPLPLDEALNALSDDLMAAWSEPLHQSLYLLALREPEAAGAATGRTPAENVQQALDAMVRFFEVYVGRGAIAPGQDLEYLAWAFLAPLANLRITYLAPSASDADRAKAGRLVTQHLKQFTALLGGDADRRPKV